MKAFSRRGAFKISDKIINEKEEKLVYKDMGKNYFMYLCSLENQKYYNLYKENKFDLQEIYDRLNSLAENTIGFFFISFSNTAYNMLFSLKTQNIECRNEKLEELIKSFDTKKLLDYLDSSSLQNSTVIKVYHLFLYYLVNDFTEKDFYELKELLIKNAADFGKKDSLHFWSNIMNIILLKLVPSDKEFYREIFELSRFFCGLKIYPDDSLEKFPLSMFRNIIFAGLFLEEYKWTENFLDEYCNYIETDQKENEVNYNKGVLCFNYKRYEESLAYLNKVNFTDIYTNITVRFYYIMNYIELKYYDSAASMIQSVRQLHRTSREIPELLSPLIKNSLKYLGEIVRCAETNNKLEYSLYREAQGPARCYNKKYVLNKMAQLI